MQFSAHCILALQGKSPSELGLSRLVSFFPNFDGGFLIVGDYGGGFISINRFPIGCTDCLPLFFLPLLSTWCGYPLPRSSPLSQPLWVRLSGDRD